MSDTAHGVRRVTFCNGCKFAVCHKYGYYCKFYGKERKTGAYDYCSRGVDSKSARHKPTATGGVSPSKGKYLKTCSVHHVGGAEGRSSWMR